ncbi:hypothetical protein N7495_007229 [Penicillium taxi]|uniref:uncharacterized protein n=1 Tax=Penicillium taxi TaxID=168475 RepID=UPI002545691F|nr:uncharacterized protein N7495_007229 [Penicillium taxi]KAJ5895538.1 hypothetical protein N7495_007229 [Penicillium taxi]
MSDDTLSDPIAEEPVAAEPTGKECIVCQEWQPNEQFVSKKAILGDGKALNLTCRTCTNKRRQTHIMKELRTMTTRHGVLSAANAARHREELVELNEWLGETDKWQKVVKEVKDSLANMEGFMVQLRSSTGEIRAVLAVGEQAGLHRVELARLRKLVDENWNFELSGR